MDVVTVAIVGLCMALGAAGLIVAVCGAIYLAIKRQATMVVTTLLLVVLLYAFAFWASGHDKVGIAGDMEMFGGLW